MIDSKIAKVSANDWIRIGATKKDGWVSGFYPVVVECTVQDYARQYLGEVSDVENAQDYTATSKKAVVDARSALQEAVNAETPDMQAIESRLAELETAISNLTLRVPVESVSLNTNTLNLKVDETAILTASVTPGDATYKDVEWSSDKEAVATVDASGNVTAVAPGEAVITATCKDDRTKTATCTVNVTSAVDKSELISLLEEAGKLNSSDYTKDGWDIFRQIVTEATGVKDDATATEHEVSEAVIALIDGMIALEKEKVYTVTVDGKKVAEGVYNQIVTITADAPQAGQKFAGWQLKDKIVSYDEVYTFAISGNMAFTATYAPQEQTIEKPLYAAVADTMIIKRADGKANVKYIAKLSIPDNYILNETGLLWYGKPDLENLCTETGPTPGTKKIVAPVISSTYQFAANVNGIPAGKTIRGVIYAKVTDKKTQQTKWVYSEEVRLTNK